NAASAAKVVEELRQKLGDSASDLRVVTMPVQLGDVILEAMMFPTGNYNPLLLADKMRERAQHHFEEVWLHRPLKSLGGVPPVDAAGHAVLRRKLLGAISFLEQCLSGAAPRQKQGDDAETIQLFDFERLRHKLGIDTAAPAPAGPVLDVGAMNAAELSAL